MQTYDISIHERAVSLASTDRTLVRTSKGVDRIRLLFDSAEWLDGFDLTCWFKRGEELRGVAITPTATTGDHLAECLVTVPYQVLATEGELGITVSGVDSDPTRYIVTERAYPLYVELEGDAPGVAPGPNPDPPSSANVVDGYLVLTGASVDSGYLVPSGASVSNDYLTF